MPIIFPKFDELYEVIINDCLEIYSEQNKLKSNNSKKDNLDIIDKIYELKYSLRENKSKNKKFSDIVLFLSFYLNDIKNFFIDKERNNSKVEFAEDFCLAYILLTGYRFNLINKIETEELFMLQLKYYKNFSNFLKYYTLTEQIKKRYNEKL